MTAVADLLLAIDELRGEAKDFIEETFRLTVRGDVLNRDVSLRIRRICEQIGELGIVDPPQVMISNENIDPADLAEPDFDEEPWCLILGKTPIARLMRARQDETTLLFFSVAGFHDWLGGFDPFLFPVGNSPDLSNATTIRVHGLKAGFGGPQLWILPPDASLPDSLEGRFPGIADVHALIHTNAVNPLRVCPAAYALTFGDLDVPEASPFVKLSACVLAACLVQELKRVDEHYEITLRGTKRLTMLLSDEVQNVTSDTLKMLVETVRWVYEERPETRLRLVMDRLSIDIEQGQSFLSGLEKYLSAALLQARDSYSFVILERKDAYHKEVRDIMKDMKSQADLYAAKVRELVNALTRDVLGILVFMGFSFIGKFDQKNLNQLLTSTELSLLVKVLAGYLALSCTLQIASHLRDSSLAYQESKTWLDVLQHYSSQADKQNRFLGPINKRRDTLRVAMWVTIGIYSLLTIVVWNLPFVIELLLAQ